ncbi:MAG: glycoside hydrolase family 16 protein [Novosphingobium sp.]|uniref:glycoside hydrolase family 16 protein n=1 Tax=Novosphingobium sp. TaxID=1874826 RepID=UPI00301A3E3D
MRTLLKCAAPLAALLAAQPALAAAPAGDWQLVWSDEFTATTIDRTKWDFDVDCWGGGNNERQCYTDKVRNARVVAGKLVITARREPTTGPALPASQRPNPSDPGTLVKRDYSSARMVTRGKASWRYGRIEVRASLPQGQGTWPAIWMLPEKWVYGGWAASGEIDIMEAVNLGVPCQACSTGKEDTILGTIHFGKQWPGNVFASTSIHYPAVLKGYHTYAIEWTPDRIIWQVDGKTYATRTRNEWWSGGSSAPGAPFDQSFHLLLNLAIGGGLPESRGTGGVSTANFPKRFLIDWVRVWQKPMTTASTPPAVGGQTVAMAAPARQEGGK